MDYKAKYRILADLWTGYRYEEDFQDFMEYNDLGMPLAILINEGIVSSTPQAEIYVEETYALFLAALEIEDKDYSDLQQMFFEAGKSEG